MLVEEMKKNIMREVFEVIYPVKNLIQSVEKIEKEAEKLSIEEQLKLVEHLLCKIRKSELIVSKKLDWTELYGSGKGLWQEDAQEYVNQLREDRI